MPKQKMRTAWLIMTVEDIQEITPTLYKLIGEIVKSNFLKLGRSHMPVCSKPMENLDIGDTVRLSYYVYEDQLKAFQQRESCEFRDRGMKYEVLVDDQWELLFHDDDPHLS